MMFHIYYVPISIPYSNLEYLPKKRWKLLPGLWFEKTPQKLKKVLEKKNSKVDSFFKLYNANYAIRIDVNQYNESLAKRILKANEISSDSEKQFASNLLSQPKVKYHYENQKDTPEYSFPDPQDMAKLVLISFCFQKVIPFSKGNVYRFSEKRENTNIVYSGGYMATNRQPIENISHRHLYAASLAEGTFNKKKFILTIHTLERYFRPYHYFVDRVAFALKYLWNAITSPFPDQIFLNMTIVLECLLSTKPMEVTHTLSERAAVMLGKSQTERLEIYQNIKKLYNLRSSIVHGRGEGKKKGIITYDSYHISPKNSQIPINEIEKLARIVFRLIQVTIEDKNLLALIQTLKKEDKINKDLDKYYLTRIFR